MLSLILKDLFSSDFFQIQIYIKNSIIIFQIIIHPISTFSLFVIIIPYISIVYRECSFIFFISRIGFHYFIFIFYFINFHHYFINFYFLYLSIFISLLFVILLVLPLHDLYYNIYFY